MLRMNNLQADGWDFSDIKYAEITSTELDRWRLEQGDIVFNRTNSKELVGKCEVFREAGDWIFASYLMRLRVDPKQVIPEFVASFLNTSAGRVQIDRESRQIIGMSNINAEEIRALRIPLPIKPRQAELLAILDEARDAQRRKLGQADALLSGLNNFVLEALHLILPQSDGQNTYAVKVSDVRGSRFDALYHAPHVRRLATILEMSPLPKIPLGVIAPDLAGGATPTRGDEELYAKEGVRFLRIMNIAPFDIRLDDVKFITEDVHQQMLGRSQLRPSDVLMTITGRVGTAAVVQPDILPANINQHIVRIRIVDKSVFPEYLAAYLNSSLGLAMTNRGVTGGTRIAVDYGTIRKLLIPIPTPEVQQNISTEIKKRRLEAQRLREEGRAIWHSAKLRFAEQLLGTTSQTGSVE